MLNPRQVEAFRAVMTTGSVTSAATMMHVTQPAVSRLIRDLEFTLKLALFERRGHPLRPTPHAPPLFPAGEPTLLGPHPGFPFAPTPPPPPRRPAPLARV